MENDAQVPGWRRARGPLAAAVVMLLVGVTLLFDWVDWPSLARWSQSRAPWLAAFAAAVTFASVGGWTWRSTATEPSRKRTPGLSWWIVVTAAVVVGLVAWGATSWLLNEANSANDRGAARVDAIKTGLGIGAGTTGIFAFLLAVRRQNHQEHTSADTSLDATERRVTELYTKAVEQLGSAKAPVRLGGLYALERLGENHRNQRSTIINVICAYLRMRYVHPTEPTNEATPEQLDRHEDRSQEAQVRITAQRILYRHRHRHRLPDAELNLYWHDVSIDLAGANLIDADLTNADLADANLNGANLIDAELTAANLIDANLTKADLAGANLIDAELTAANLTGANLTKADLTKADLRAADLTGATLTGAILSDANLSGANLAKAKLDAANFTGANLTGADLADTTLTDANLTGARLTGAHLKRANLTDANLTRADVTSAILVRTNLPNADLTDATLTGANLTDATLTNANLTRAILTNANLTRANLTGANLTKAHLTRAHLTRANLTRGTLTGADLRNAELANAALTGADLVGANLTGADLSYANLNSTNLNSTNLRNADLTNACVSESTRIELPPQYDAIDDLIVAKAESKDPGHP
ncbi:pentapeptide repeat-containing protein [Amycolatopsis mediterranei]|uniref:pentapeptide repeat-containing protein n=1 Tax=Amycolatopsis mediterranei TaxID=33910 RepID=UPI00343C5042